MVLIWLCCHVRVHLDSVTRVEVHNLEPVTPVEVHNVEPVTPIEVHNVEPVTPIEDRIARAFEV